MPSVVRHRCLPATPRLGGALGGQERGVPQQVTSAVVSRAQASAAKSSRYSPNDSRPLAGSRCRWGRGAGHRRRSTSAWAGTGGSRRTGARCPPPRWSPPGPRVRRWRRSRARSGWRPPAPIAPSEAIAAATYSATNSSRTIPPASGTVVPDSSVTGPIGNRAAPVARATAVTPNVTASANTTIAAYFTLRTRARPAGTASR